MKKMRKLIPVLGFLAVVMALSVATLSIVSCAGVPPVAREAGKAYELVILHTNDHHGAILPVNGAAGLAERATFIKETRAANGNVLLLDAGDINTGTALSNAFKAEIDIKAYNLMGYDAVTLGNHEFDRDGATLDRQRSLATFPWISANIQKAGGKLLAPPYVVQNFEGFRIGIFGLTTRRTVQIASPDKSLVFLDEIETARTTVAILRDAEKCDIVIAVVHMGLASEAEGHVSSRDLAREVRGIDLVIDGHSHSFLEEPVMVEGTPVVSAAEWGKYVGRGSMEIVDGKVRSFAWKPVKINDKENKTYAPDPEVAAIIAPYKEKADVILKEVVANAQERFEFGDRLSRKKEIALGNMVNDATVWYVENALRKKIDFAFTNGGNIRTELPKGPITREQIATVLPFDNWMYLTTMKGEGVIRLFQFIAAIPQGAGGWAQVSGAVRYTIDYAGADGKGVLKDLRIAGKSVDPAALYTFATNDYLMAGGDGYAVLADNVSSWNTSTTLRDIVIAYAAEKKTLVPATDGRITVVGGLTF